MDAATGQPRMGTGVTETAAVAGLKGGMARLTEGLRALGPARLAALGATGLVTLGLIGWMVFRTASTPMALLYADLDQRDAAQVVAALERARIPHEIGAGGTTIRAAEDQIPRLRLMLARDGLPAGGSIGYEIFDRQGGLTATPFQQDMNRLRALEGELARSIRGLEGVNAARVHLALPRREPFSRERGEPQASIVLQMRGSQRLDRAGVQAVVHLVAAGVPGLKPQNVAVVDNRGELLARGADGDGALGQGRTMDELRRVQEMRVARGIEEMLERTLGPGRVRAEATIEMDVERVQTTQERFDSDNQVPRSQSTTTETNRTGEQQNVSVANQLPGAPAQQPPSGPQTQENRQEETINYEIGRTSRTSVREQPVLRRQSVAVLVDGIWEPGENGGPARFRERNQAELDRIAALVRGAMGFDSARGDRLEVVSLRFTDPTVEGETGVAGMFGLNGLTPAMLTRLIEMGIAALVVLAALLLVGRPAVRSLVTGVAPRRLGATAAGAAGAGLIGEVVNEAEGEVDDLSTTTILGNRVRNASLTRVTDLVERYPEETLAVVRRWLAPTEQKS